MESPGSTPSGRFKVERVVERYDLGEMPDILASRWQGEGDDAASLRTLAREFNLAVLRRGLDDADHAVSEPELETIYAVLSGNEGSGADRTTVRRDLERRGVAVEQLEGDFVTHQAVHTYLTKGRGITKSTDDTDPIERARNTIDRLRSRTAAVTESELERLESASAVTIGSTDVIVNVRVTCRDCGAYTNITDILDAGGCDCEESSTSKNET